MLTRHEKNLGIFGSVHAYRCSLCNYDVPPFSDDQGKLICPYCEATGLVVLDDMVLDRLEAAREFARQMGLSEQFERQLDYLACDARGNISGEPGDENKPMRQCVLATDFAPYSFSFAHFVLPQFTANGKRSIWFNGGLIYQGPSCPADGSFPSLTVSLSSRTGWFCHT